MQREEGGPEKDDNVRVAVRCRPFTPQEVRDRRKTVVAVDELSGEIRVKVSYYGCHTVCVCAYIILDGGGGGGLAAKIKLIPFQSIVLLIPCRFRMLGMLQTRKECSPLTLSLVLRRSRQTSTTRRLDR